MFEVDIVVTPHKKITLRDLCINMNNQHYFQFSMGGIFYPSRGARKALTWQLFNPDLILSGQASRKISIRQKWILLITPIYAKISSDKNILNPLNWKL